MAAKLRLLHKPDTLSEQIYLDLRSRLQRCEIAPADRLVDQDVAATYGTSRMPAREALVRLANEGYLVATTRGFTLPQLTLAEIRDIFEVRSLLEPRAAANAARDMDEETAQALRQVMSEARNAAAEGDANRMILANIDFRKTWLSRVRNTGLANTIGRFIDHVQAVRFTTFQAQDTLDVVLRGLEHLYEAFVARDPARASARMADFIAAAERQFFAVASHDPAVAPERDTDTKPARQAP